MLDRILAHAFHQRLQFEAGFQKHLAAQARRKGGELPRQARRERFVNARRALREQPREGLLVKAG
jgi:hypothetical protein